MRSADHIKKLLESMTFAGEPEQKPGDQVRGDEKVGTKFLVWKQFSETFKIPSVMRWSPNVEHAQMGDPPSRRVECLP